MPSDKRKEPSSGRAKGTNRRASKSTSSSRQPTTGPSFTLNSIPAKTTADKRRVSGGRGESSAAAPYALTVAKEVSAVGVGQTMNSVEDHLNHQRVVIKRRRDCHIMRRYLPSVFGHRRAFPTWSA